MGTFDGNGGPAIRGIPCVDPLGTCEPPREPSKALDSVCDMLRKRETLLCDAERLTKELLEIRATIERALP